MAIGPVIEDGFYYDIFLEDSLNEDDLVKIEERMLELAKSNYDVIREFVDKEKAKKVFKSRKEPYKLEIIKEIPKGETIA